MSRLVMAGYAHQQDAEEALVRLSHNVPLSEIAVIDGSAFGQSELERLRLTERERGDCEAKLAETEFLLVARPTDEADVDRVVEILTTAPVAEERVPLVEEALRVGKRQVVRGGARVRTFMAEQPVREDMSLLDEQATIERRPANRLVTDQELDSAGLLKDRVIDVSEMREIPQITKETFVREEILVRKTVQERVEQIDEVLRRTEATVEEIRPGAEVGLERRRDR